jgi:hypothetical protein
VLRNRRGMIQYAGIIAGVLGVIFLLGILIFYSQSVSAQTVSSLLPKRAGCDSPVITVIVEGELSVKDVAGLTLQAGPTDLQIKRVYSPQAGDLYSISKNSLCFFCFSQNYDWNVEIFDLGTGNSKGIDKGNGVLDSSGDPVNIESFVIQYNVPDNNCDGRIDDHLFKIIGTVVTEESGVSDSLDKQFKFMDGRFSLS